MNFAHRQHIVGCRTRYRLEARLRIGEPGALAITVAREIRHEKQIEMAQVIGQVLRRQRQRGGEAAVVGRLQAHALCERLRRRRRLRHRTDAADARHIHQRIERMFSGKYLLEAAIHGRIHIGGAHAPVFDIERDFEVAFDAVEGANDAASHS